MGEHEREQADDQDMQELAEAEQGNNTIGPLLDTQTQYARGYSQGPGLNIQITSPGDVRRLADVINAQAGGRRRIYQSLEQIEADAQRKREQAAREQALAELTAQGIGTDTTVPFTPRLLAVDLSYGRAVAIAAISLRACATCDKWMISRRMVDKDHVWSYNNILSEQGKRAGFVVESESVNRAGKPICSECRDAGKATFVCYICKQERSSEQEQESYGYPPEEILCTVCYAAVPARDWDTVTARLMEAHRYDGD